ncbi:MAG: BPSS1780 family membrane protein [Pseudomonadota bacterium]|nr:BPSS1780 family membrane protein [Pseudomonadota bacterium]
MENRLKIIYSGDLQPHVRAEETIQRFAAAFKVPTAKARSLILSEKRLVLKKDLDEAAAERYRAALEKIGLVVHIEPSEPEAEGAEEARTPERPVNPYAPPSSDLRREPEATNGDMTGPVAVPAGHGWRWITRGFWHFKRNALAWMLALVVFYAITIVLSLVPILGTFAATFLGPVFTAGFMIGAHEQQNGREFRLEHLFAGFSNNGGQLALVGVLVVAGALIISVGMALLLGGSIAAQMVGMDPEAFQAQDPELVAEMLGPSLLIPLLAGMLFFIPLAMAAFFAPALVSLDDLSAVSAMKLSFVGCLKNILPFLVYGIMAMLLAILGALPILLGLLVVLPTLTASFYAAYRDIYYG